MAIDNPFVRKLARFVRLTERERAAIVHACDASIRHVDARADVVREGVPSSKVIVVLSGWACRYVQLDDGRRQILNYLLPGDHCSPNVVASGKALNSVAALTHARIAEIPAATLDEIIGERSRLAHALRCADAIAEATTHQWIVNLGRRNAAERIAYLFSEILERLEALGLSNGISCEIPLTQVDLADSAGLSLVHTNRSLKDLRTLKLIEFRKRRLTVLDLDRLKRFANFRAGLVPAAKASGSRIERAFDRSTSIPSDDFVTSVERAASHRYSSGEGNAA